MRVAAGDRSAEFCCPSSNDGGAGIQSRGARRAPRPNGRARRGSAPGPRRELRRPCDANPSSTLLRSVRRGEGIRAQREVLGPGGSHNNERLGVRTARCPHVRRAGAQPRRSGMAGERATLDPDGDLDRRRHPRLCGRAGAAPLRARARRRRAPRRAGRPGAPRPRSAGRARSPGRAPGAGHLVRDEPTVATVQSARVALGIDTGCVYGGHLTAYSPERDEFRRVRAARAYVER